MMARLILFTAAVANIGAAFGAAAHMYAADDITFAPTVLMLCCLAAAFLCGCALDDFDRPKMADRLVDQVDTSFHSERG
jgi:hypothetical protein